MKSRIYIQPTSQYIFICHRSIYSSAIAVYIHPPSQYIFNRHRSIYSFAIAVYLPKPGQRVAGTKCPSQSETMIKISVFYLHPVLSIQPVTVSVSAPVILSVLRDGEQDDRYRKSDKNRHRQPAGVMPHDPGFIPRIHSIHAPLSHSSAFHPCTSFEQHIFPHIYRVSPACSTGCSEVSMELHHERYFSQMSHFHDVDYRFGR